MKTKKKWNDWLWIWSALYLSLGFFNIMFAWLGLICFITPLLVAIFGKSKAYCNSYCGRSQLFNLLGNKLHLSRNRPTPKWVRSKWWRYGFLTFFMTMFFNMLYVTFLVFNGTNGLKQAVKLLWTFKLPWQFAYHGTPFIAEWTAQFAFGFYSIMLTSTVLGIITMILFKSRSWCVYCPMGTMTQTICRIQK
ncbi:MAG: 4Fe-4S binding protein [Clostridia bacterium]|jgi:hypothetical protein|nr:4Fe-4S binding protein [Clostridia bacterium]